MKKQKRIMLRCQFRSGGKQCTRTWFGLHGKYCYEHLEEARMIWRKRDAARKKSVNIRNFAFGSNNESFE